MKLQALCKIQYLDSKGSRLVAHCGEELSVEIDVAKQLITNGSAKPADKPAKPADKPAKPAKPADKPAKPADKPAKPADK